MRLEKAQQQANQNDIEYMGSVERYTDAHERWEEDFRTACNVSNLPEIDFFCIHNLLDTGMSKIRGRAYRLHQRASMGICKHYLNVVRLG